MSTYKNLMTVCCAAVLALGLVACGGGGSGGPTTGGGGGGGMMPKPVAVDLSGVATDAMRTAGMAEIDAGDSATIGDVTYTCAADGDDCSVTVVDDGTATSTGGTVTAANSAAYDMRIATEAELNSVMGLVTAAADAVDALTGTSSDDDIAAAKEAIADAQAALDGATLISATDRTAQQEAIDAIDIAGAETMIADARAEAAAAVVAATAAALTKETAISTEAAQVVGGTAGTDGEGGADAGLGGSSAPATTDSQNAGEYNLDIKRDGTATTITVTVEGATADDNETFVKAEDLTSTSNPGQMLTHTMDADMDGNVVTEVAVVYSDIEAPKATAFAMVAGQTLNARDLDTTADADGDGDATNDFTALGVVTANFAQIMAAGFSSSGSGTLNYLNDDATTEDMDEAFETAGTYNGAPGTYRCDGTSQCSVTYNAMGGITGVAGDWVFTPDPGAMSDVPDADYLHYGFWLKRTTDAMGAVTYNEVETFAGSSVAASGSTGSVEGMATYAGGAAGVYVIKTAYDPVTGELTNANSGHFSADASLTAYFGGGDIPANKQDTLTGTIDNFMLSGGEMNDWSVALQSDADLTTDGIQGSDTGTHSGTAKGGVMGEDGSFSATFHGPVTDADNNPIQPHTVVGEFNAVFNNGSVTGGFGARKQ